MNICLQIHKLKKKKKPFSFARNCRSYYRCTTQKCMVKKRVERSFQDPSIVITTYEGQHNHHCPATLRGNAAGMLSPSLLASTSIGQSFPQDFLTRLLPPSNQGDQTSIFYQNHDPQYQHQLYAPDYGLLQDLVPSFIHKKQPWTLSSLSRPLIINLSVSLVYLDFHGRTNTSMVLT